MTLMTMKTPSALCAHGIAYFVCWMMLAGCGGGSASAQSPVAATSGSPNDGGPASSVPPSETAAQQDAATSNSAQAQTVNVGPDVRFLVRLGVMRGGAGGQSSEVQTVLGRALRQHMSTRKTVAVVTGDVLPDLGGRHIPLLTLDGLVAQVKETPTSTGLEVRAKVEIAVLRNQELKATIAGAATSAGSGALSQDIRRELRAEAIDGAVQSAMQGIEEHLSSATRN